MRASEVEPLVHQTLQALAARLAEEDQENPGGVHGEPSVAVLALERSGPSLTVRAVVDNMIWHMAQSGSDWFDHAAGPHKRLGAQRAGLRPPGDVPSALQRHFLKRGGGAAATDVLS